MVAFWVVVAGCSPVSSNPPPAVTPQNHPYFPIGVGAVHQFGKTVDVDGSFTCDSCHRPTADSFTQVRCDQCHGHTEDIATRLHLSLPGFPTDTSAVSDPDLKAELRGAKCISCHPNSDHFAFDHAMVTNDCAQCHAPGTAFAALPVAGFTHLDFGTADCGGCHVVTSWQGAGLAPNDVSDPMHDLSLTGDQPNWNATTISSVTPLVQSLPSPMNHQATAIDSAVLGTCGNCHADSANGNYYPGAMHDSLRELGARQPIVCAECHTRTRPRGFVGPQATSPARTPSTGEMRHEAVAWANTNGTWAPTTTTLVPSECGVCHTTPVQPDGGSHTTWATVSSQGPSPRFHASLAALNMPVGSCLDCHANSRPSGLLSSTSTPPAALPNGLSFDHSSPNALGDCVTCHSSNTVWSGGRFHVPGVAAPAACASCHEQERPTTTVNAPSTWSQPGYTGSPFDYVGGSGFTHGGGEDCALCHATSAGSGAWAGAHFSHDQTTLKSCSECHTTQRPAAGVSLGDGGTFSHTLNGTGDCWGCHQATVTRGSFVAATPIPGSDWRGGQEYPGSSLVTATNQSITVKTWALQRASATAPVTGITSQNTTYANAMLHTSSAIPTEMAPGAGAAYNAGTCWHCHTNTNGVVTQYVGGTFHQAINSYRATPSAAITALGQPRAQCTDCHAAMRPDLIIEESNAAVAAAVLAPMNHSATLSNGTSLATLDCSSCHAKAQPAGVTWTDGKFHSNLPSGAQPGECLGCHYRLSTDATANVTSGASYAMKHGSAQLTSSATRQTCDTCHASALGKAAAGGTPASNEWIPGALHSSLAASQPVGCLDCHSGGAPSGLTQSSLIASLTGGATATNGNQWMSHAVTDVAGKDCAVCHKATATITAWSKGDSFHAAVANPTACNTCHGVGTTPGTGNNLPSGLTSSSTTTTASTGAGLKDQITHADVNATGHDCNFCHTQKGASSTASIQGKEWQQASFHKNFTAASPLVINTTTGRCSNCHLNVRPGSGFTPDHSAFMATSGSTDCSSCHSYPGTSTTTPNWLGAAGGAPATISVGGFTITGTSSTQTGIANLPHPTVGSQACTVCHASAGGGRHAIGYDHASSLIGSNCNACHEMGSDLVGTPYNGNTTLTGVLGDTRPYGVVSVPANKGGSSRNISSTKHFYATDCKECHSKPSGVATTSTSNATLQTKWAFHHTTGNMSQSTCNYCH